MKVGCKHRKLWPQSRTYEVLVLNECGVVDVDNEVQRGNGCSWLKRNGNEF